MVEGAGFEPAKLARQIYSLIPLATREPLPKEPSIVFTPSASVNSQDAMTVISRRHLVTAGDRGRFGSPIKEWSWREELNPQPADYKSAALPIELRQPEVAPYDAGRSLVRTHLGRNGRAFHN
jgi:hypothetical protein